MTSDTNQCSAWKS